MRGMIHILSIPSKVDSVSALISFWMIKCIVNLYNILPLFHIKCSITTSKASLRKKFVYQPIYQFQNV